MNKAILHTEKQDFIKNNINSNINELILRGSPFSDVDIKELAEQIEAKKKCQNKLPTWFKTPGIYYPNKLNVEQTSSEVTAEYKSKIIIGDSLIDITGGLGVDDYYFSKKFNQVVHCEMNSYLSELARHNFEKLHVSNIQPYCGDGLDFLDKTDETYDWVYIDPSRRSEVKGKVFLLDDCLPNVPKNLDLLFVKTNQILIKTSPLLDISIGLGELQYVKELHVVAVNNEVKELLWVLEKGFSNEPKIQTINLGHENSPFSFFPSEETQQEVLYGMPKTFVYEPNSAILKSGGFKVLTKYFNVKKLHQHSHLYTSDSLLEFPGRSFKILQILTYNKKALKQLNITKANITTRNFPESVEQLRKKFKIKDGGETYLFFTTNCEGDKIILVCQKPS